MNFSCLGAISRNLLGAGVVLGVIASALFFSMFLFAPFEPAKAFAIRWLAVALLPALGIRLVQRWLRPDPDQPGAPAWWLVLLAAFLGLVTVSTVWSVAPAVSFWGSTTRGFGGLTMAALVMLGVAAAETDQQRWRFRAVWAVILASIPIVFYASLQLAAEDPLPGEAFVYGGPSFLGNPNWVGAWMVMAMPLTCAALVGGWSEGPRSKLWRMLEQIVLAALLALQIFVVVQLKARAALLGMAVALVFFTVFLAILAGRRRVVMAGSALAVAVVLTVLVVGFDRVVHKPNKSPSQRIEIWETAARLIRADPSRVTTGYGPDTLELVIGPVFPADTAATELLELRPTNMWDRAHSFPLDALATLGLAGTLLFLVLVGAVVCVGLERAGLLRTRADQCKALGVSLVGGLLGAFVGMRFFLSPALACPGFGVGLLGGLAIFMFVRACRKTAEPAGVSRLSATKLTVAALVAAILGHLAEIQMGFQVVSTGVLFWVYAGLVLSRAPRSGLEPPSHCRDGGQPIVPGQWRDGMVDGLVVASVLVTIAVSLFASTARWDDRRIVGLLGATWIATAVLTCLSPAVTRGGRSRHRWMVTVGASLVWSGLFVFALAVALRTRPAMAPLLFFVFLTASVVLMAIAQDATASPGRAVATFWGPWFLLIVLVLAALWPAYRLAVTPMRADTFARIASVFLDKEDVDSAIPLLREAVRRAPWNDDYAAMLAGAYLDKAKISAPDAPWLIRSETLLLEITQRNPRLARCPLGLSALYIVWAELVPSRRAHYLAESRRYALLALRLDPVRSRQAVENQIAAIFSRQGMTQDVATVEAKLLVGHAVHDRR